MSDDKTKRDYRDKSRINTSEPYEVQYWTEKWKISRQQLVGAARATGSSGVKTIEKYLKDKGAI